MNILFWSSTFWPKIGGVEVLASRFLPALQAHGHEFAVITPQLGHEQENCQPFRNIPIHRFAFTEPSLFQDIDLLASTRQRISKIKHDFQPDLIHVNAIDASIFFHLTTWHDYPAPMLVTLHGRWTNLIAKQDSLITKTLNNADWVTGCSKAILKYGLEFAPKVASRSSVIYNGIEPSTITINPLNCHRPTVLCLGRLVEDKGIDIALDAFALTIDAYPKLRILIAGDGEARAELEQQATYLGLNNVQFLGWIPPEQVPALINESSIVVMPSRQDSFPLTALEAGIMGRPVVASRTGGLPEMILADETGLLVEKENSVELSKAIISLLDNPQLANKLGQAARNHIQQQFNWEDHVLAYDRLYRKISKNKIN